MRLIRDPLVHFAVLGIVIFAVYAVLNDGDAPQDAATPRIVVDAATQDLLIERFSQVWRRPPTEAEQAALVEDYIEGRVMVREARALGLDQGDSVVEQRLRQKMTFLLSGSGAPSPSEADLRAFYDADPARYGAAPKIAFQQVPLGEAQPTDSEVAELIAALQAGADPAEIGTFNLLPTDNPLAPSGLIDRQFGKGLADQIARLEPGEWGGPVRSGYGFHLVRLDQLVPARVPPFEDVIDRVRNDWEAESSETRLQERIAALRDRYTIDIVTEPTE